MRYQIQITCGNGHKQTIDTEGMDRVNVARLAGVMDGSIFPVHPGRESSLSKCEICGAPYTCTVANEHGEPLVQPGAG